MKRWMAAALLGCAALAHAQISASSANSAAKKELVARVLQLQQSGIESIARGIVERPAMQLMQGAANALQARVPADRREALGRSIEADVKRFVDESVPLLRDRAINMAPTALGPLLEEKFSEDELKQLIAWFESPTNKKYQQLAPEMQNILVQKLLAEAAPLVDPKLKALQQKIQSTLSGAEAPSEAASKPAPKAARPAAAASKASSK